MQLEIKGNSYGLIWGTRAFRLAEKRLDMDMNEIFLSVTDEHVILALTYSAMLNWVQDRDESADLPFTFTQFENWLNEQPQDVATKISEDYKASTLQGKSVSERYEELNAIYEAAEGTALNPGKPVKKKKLPSQK